MSLAVWASPYEILSIFIHRWPKESTLPDFRLSTEHTIVASIWCCMAFLYDLTSFCSGHKSSESHMHILGIDMVHPIGGVCSHRLTSFLFSPGAIYPKTIKFTMFAYQGCEVDTLRSISSRKEVIYRWFLCVSNAHAR